jgi:hypothetical protein
MNARLQLVIDDEPIHQNEEAEQLPEQPVPVGLEAEIIAVLDEQPRSREPSAAAFQRKEHALRELFAALDVHDARVLHRRLTIPMHDDPIEQRFARLVAERKARLIAFLADARRRAARRRY